MAADDLESMPADNQTESLRIEINHKSETQREANESQPQMNSALSFVYDKELQNSIDSRRVSEFVSTVNVEDGADAPQNKTLSITKQEQPEIGNELNAKLLSELESISLIHTTQNEHALDTLDATQNNSPSISNNGKSSDATPSINAEQDHLKTLTFSKEQTFNMDKLNDGEQISPKELMSHTVTDLKNDIPKSDLNMTEAVAQGTSPDNSAQLNNDHKPNDIQITLAQGSAPTNIHLEDDSSLKFDLKMSKNEVSRPSSFLAEQTDCKKDIHVPIEDDGISYNDLSNNNDLLKAKPSSVRKNSEMAEIERTLTSRLAQLKQITSQKSLDLEEASIKAKSIRQSYLFMTSLNQSRAITGEYNDMTRTESNQSLPNKNILSQENNGEPEYVKKGRELSLDNDEKEMSGLMSIIANIRSEDWDMVKSPVSASHPPDVPQNKSPTNLGTSISPPVINTATKPKKKDSRTSPTPRGNFLELRRVR